MVKIKMLTLTVFSLVLVLSAGTVQAQFGSPALLVDAPTQVGLQVRGPGEGVGGVGAAISLVATPVGVEAAWEILSTGQDAAQGPGKLNIRDLLNAADDFTITTSGNVGIGTTSPSFKLDVAGAAHATSFPVSSDKRLKTNIKPLSAVMEKLDKIQGMSFEWSEQYKALGRDTGHREIGVIAQDVERVFPELVTTWGPENYRAVDYGRLTAVLIEAVKQLRADNQALKHRFDMLEGSMPRDKTVTRLIEK